MVASAIDSPSCGMMIGKSGMECEFEGEGNMGLKLNQWLPEIRVPKVDAKNWRPKMQSGGEFPKERDDKELVFPVH
jgi:hypothetical protein